MSENDHSIGPIRDDGIESTDSEHRARERSGLVNARRARQTRGTSGATNARLILSAGLMGGSVVLFFAVAGPTAALKVLGIGRDNDRAVSKVGMEVEKDSHRPVHLDFAVPASTEPEKKELDPNAAWKAKIKVLQDQIAELERKKQGSVSSGEIEALITRYSENTKRQFEDERKAMTEENARLKAAAERAEEERQRAEEAGKLQSGELKERQKRDKMQRESSSVVVDAADGPAGMTTESDKSATDQNQNARFLKTAASSTYQTSVSQRLPDPSRTVVQGTIISAVLETAIDTELPGNIRAQVMEPVYSFDGARVLMPSGTILIGEFNNDVNLARRRVLIAWNRAITPSGQSIALGSTGADTLGRSGTEGNVNNRYGTKFGAAILISAITTLPSILSNRNSQSESGTTSKVGGGQVAGQMSDTASAQASGTLDQYLSLPPVIKIPQGEEIRVFVNRDLVFR
ncbi:TrbI/VirB10 family protein [Rhizobium laguerreae]|uniref:TrbI/VirB10 family protein n=1 Tax=Rhizobium laguerreae TaxID=1076926 RepID=UPI001C90C051|nr:TrbI/VirB10 family protein [Rhizobium laguerreae]MBY3349164.1 TrbI/VirB10 family protein [Rhizobium laguerreae]MBY3356226.1 TrbI/VirB10 family protein [Rhizobium laguerreae]MBY3377305.1 TrbI/VirB10 family protein [Rhizobium laguerreae]MBY3432535.1 TrbI/VirB10 family protein [Rhizobium laguerreae]MBY3441047.1 TrbI/VirB10 family protein [Rhizobium laguerreae]